MKKLLSKLLLLFVVLIIIVPLAQAEDQTIPQHIRNQKQGNKMKPSDVHDLFRRYFAEQDIKGLSTLFHENAMFIPGENRAPLIGRKKILEELQTYFGSSVNIETTSASIHEHGDIALVKSTWVIHSESGDINGMAIEVMKKIDNKWVYIIDNPYGI